MQMRGTSKEYVVALGALLLCFVFIYFHWTRYILSMIGLQALFLAYYATLYAIWLNSKHLTLEDRCTVSGPLFIGLEPIDKVSIFAACEAAFWMEWLLLGAKTSSSSGLIHPLVATTLIPAIVFGVVMFIQRYEHMHSHKVKV